MNKLTGEQSSRDGTAPTPHQELLSLAVSRVEDGTLPMETQPRLYAGPAQNGRCSLCGDPIEAGDIEYETTSITDDGSIHNLYFHMHCYHAWREACGRERGKSTS